MSTYQIHVFISHSWTYSGHYDKLESWIFKEKWSVGQASLNFRDYSVPKSHPIHNARNDRQLKEAIYTQIRMSHVVLIPTAMYVNYSFWIQKEIEGAKYYGKPIIAVHPWPQERKASVVMNNRTAEAGWNKEPLVRTIWEQYRNAY